MYINSLLWIEEQSHISHLHLEATTGDPVESQKTDRLPIKPLKLDDRHPLDKHDRLSPTRKIDRPLHRLLQLQQHVNRKPTRLSNQIDRDAFFEEGDILASV